MLTCVHWASTFHAYPQGESPQDAAVTADATSTSSTAAAAALSQRVDDGKLTVLTEARARWQARAISRLSQLAVATGRPLASPTVDAVATAAADPPPVPSTASAAAAASAASATHAVSAASAAAAPNPGAPARPRLFLYGEADLYSAVTSIPSTTPPPQPGIAPPAAVRCGPPRTRISCSSHSCNHFSMVPRLVL